MHRRFTAVESGQGDSVSALEQEACVGPRGGFRRVLVIEADRRAGGNELHHAGRRSAEQQGQSGGIERGGVLAPLLPHLAAQRPFAFVEFVAHALLRSSGGAGCVI